MANTGFIINPTIQQYFTSGPSSGSEVSASFEVNLTRAPFSASLNNEDFFNRSFDPESCEPGFEDCLIPVLTSLITGSRRGRFAINYVTESGFNPPINITASISNDVSFSTSEVFSASIGNIIPVTTSFVSGTVYFQAFTSCSGPDPSPNASPLSFTYDLLPPSLDIGTVNLIFKNNLSSPMQVELRSLRGNANYIIGSKQSITYDYTTSPNPGAWTSTGRSEDVTITIKGGSKSTYGNFIQRSTSGIEKETYTTEGGFGNSNSSTDKSSTFQSDKGVTFKIRQLVLPKSGTITNTTFTLLQNTPPPPPIVPEQPPLSPTGPPSPPVPYIRTVFGSTPYNNSNNVCATTGVNYKEKTYFSRNGYLYDSRADALDNTRLNFPYSKNYILTSSTVYLIVNQVGFIQNRGGCVLPTITISNARGSYSTQEEACKRKKVNGTSYSYKDNRLQGASLSGRYPLYSGTPSRGGRNVILSAGRIIGYETCGTELTTVQYGSIGWPNSSYPLLTPENLNPRRLNMVCSNPLKPYSLGPSGIVYYDVNSQYAYVPVGLGNRWFKTTSNNFVNFNRGRVIDTTSPC
tara:strand:- start:248 stop:1975 length:1728 start_codon:yes stop_codon:yes gene_type:complete